MTSQPDYNINLDNKFGFLTKVDIPRLLTGIEHPWFNQTLCAVNDCVVRLGVFAGGREFHWHKHDNEDEFFFVLEGKFEIDLEDKKVILEPHQGYTIPRGTMHLTRAPERAVVLMVEGSSVTPTGDV